MDTVILDGKKYEKSSLVAKRFGYTADYMGQLSRGEKVDAQLVGRSWYVYAPSVEQYQDGLYENDDVETATSQPPPTTAEDPAADKITKPDNAPDAKQSSTKTSLRDLGFASSSESSTPPKPPVSPTSKTFSAPTKAAKPHWRQARYDSDTTELVPTVARKTSTNKDVSPSTKSSKIRIHTIHTGNFSVPKPPQPAPQNRTSPSGKSINMPPRNASPVQKAPATISSRRNSTQNTPASTTVTPDDDSITVTDIPRNTLFWGYKVVFWSLSLATFFFVLATLFLVHEATYMATTDSYVYSLSLHPWGAL